MAVRRPMLQTVIFRTVRFKTVLFNSILPLILAAAPVVAHAQVFSLPAPPPPPNRQDLHRVEAPRTDAPSSSRPTSRLLTGTAFFVDGNGHLLTARHTVEGCRNVVITKERWRTTGRVTALSSRVDLALIKAPKTLGLWATFPRTVGGTPNDMVFASSYDSLAGLLSMGGMMANARVMAPAADSERGHLVMDSTAGVGTSGAPVLDRLGLVQGVVSRRTLVNRVLAVNASESKAFLSANGISADQDDRPQIAATGSRAHRAASLSTRVTCVPD